MATNMLHNTQQGNQVSAMMRTFESNGLGGLCNAAAKMKSAMSAFEVEAMTPQEYVAAIDRLEAATNEFRLYMTSIGKADVPAMARKIMYQTQTAREYGTQIVAHEKAAAVEAERQRVAAAAAQERAVREAEEERVRAVEREAREKQEQQQRDEEEASRIRRLLNLPPAPVS